jgi:hypothetical protein
VLIALAATRLLRLVRLLVMLPATRLATRLVRAAKKLAIRLVRRIATSTARKLVTSSVTKPAKKSATRIRLASSVTALA